MPCQALDRTSFPQIKSQRKCPTADDGHHVDLAAMMLHLATIGLQPITASLGCGCKIKCSDIPEERHDVRHVHHLKKVKKLGQTASVKTLAGQQSQAKKRRDFDEAQLMLWPNTRR